MLERCFHINWGGCKSHQEFTAVARKLCKLVQQLQRFACEWMENGKAKEKAGPKRGAGAAPTKTYHNQNQVQMQTLAEHPKVVDKHKIMHHQVECNAPGL